MGLRRDRSIRSPEALTAEGDRLRIGADGDQSFEEAFYCYKKAAAKSYVPAMYRLGCMYESGHGTGQSYKEAYRWYDRAALKGDRDAKAALGFLYESGMGCRRSRPLAIENLASAAAAGSTRAMNNLGLIYLDRSGREFSDHAAMTWFQKGNLAQFPPSVANLARLYETGKGLARNCATAANLFRKAARDGNLPAKVYLAEMLKYGIGVDVNQSASAHLFMEAARWGDPVALAEVNGEDVDTDAFVIKPETDTNPRVQFNYGLMFLFGCRAPYAPETAFNLLESAAEAGCTDAMYVLGQAYENGIGCEKSLPVAKKWYTWGSDKGNGPCSYVLGWMAQKGTCLPERDYDLAVSFYRKAVKDSVDDDARADALNALACILVNDVTKEFDPAEGLECFKQAAELGHPEAQFFAGQIMIDEGDASGWGYIEKAAEQGDDRAAKMLEERR